MNTLSRRRLASLWILVLLAFSGCRQAPAQAGDAQPAQSLPSIEVHFSPHGGCTEAVVKELDSAKTTVLLQAYSFTSAPIAKALLAAHKRGVKVEVILDKSQKTAKYSEADFLVNVGIPAKIDARHTIAHNKVMVIDGQTVITGRLQLHQGRRGAQRRESPCHPLPGTCGEVRGELENSCRPFRSLRRSHGGLLANASRRVGQACRTRSGSGGRGLRRFQELACLP
jgi:hypothetical protein